MNEVEITKTYTMRISKDLYKLIEKEAKKEERSVNYIINRTLKEAFKYETKEK